MLLTEVRLAQRTVGGFEGTPPAADGRYTGAAQHGSVAAEPLLLALLGDSTAAGHGVHHAHETPGAVLANSLAAAARRPIDLVNVALTGARSDDLARQVSLLLDRPSPPDVAVIMIGANDVTHRLAPAKSVRLLGIAVRRLREAGTEVIVGTCPDLGTIEPVYQPLRWVARRLSRQLAAAQTIAVVEAGGRTISLGALLGPEFEARPKELFGPDHYHPSAEGYATAAMAILPTLCTALGLWPPDELPDALRGEGVLPVAEAAVEAAAEGGTEVTATALGGRESGPRGRWALLKHRRWRRLPVFGPADDAARSPAEETPPPENALGEHDLP